MLGHKLLLAGFGHTLIARLLSGAKGIPDERREDCDLKPLFSATFYPSHSSAFKTQSRWFPSALPARPCENFPTLMQSRHPVSFFSLRFFSVFALATSFAPGAFAAADAGAAPATAKRPNLLIILADDLGYSDVGCYGGEIPTPNLDRLASRGLRFSQFYNTGRCWPTRAALLTGYYAQAVRRDAVGTLTHGARGTRPEWAKLLPDYLRAQGYRSYHSGKWHLDGEPKGAGFDRTYLVERSDYHFAPPPEETESGELAPPQAGERHSTESIANQAITHLRAHAAQAGGAPFFSYVAFLAPHFPLHASADAVARHRERYLRGWDELRAERWARLATVGFPVSTQSPVQTEVGPPYHFPEDLKKLGSVEVTRPVAWSSLTKEQREFQAEKMAVHAAMVEQMDAAIGRIVAQVESMGALDDTLILFLSDNGATAEIMVRGDGHDQNAPVGSARTFVCLGPGWSTACNTPMRLHKTWMHEGGVATPLIAHWPKGIRSRAVWTHAPGHVVDVVPTMLELAGATGSKATVTPAFAGQSFAAVLADPQARGRDEIWFRHEGNRAFRKGDWKIAAAGEKAPWQLFDLSKDRGETRDLEAQFPDRVAEMDALWREELQRCEQLASWTSKSTVDAADFGLSTQGDASPAILRLIEACKQSGARRVSIPKGVYHFHADKAFETHLHISNNDSGLKRIAFPLHGVDGLEIDGNGSLFIMHGTMMGLDLKNSKNVTLKNFSIDWKAPFYFQGSVVAVHEDKNAFDLEVLDECTYEIVANELVFLEKTGTASRPWKNWPAKMTRDLGWQQNIDWNIWYDPQTGAAAYKGEASTLISWDETRGVRYRVEELRPGLLRFFDATPRLPKKGWVLVVKGNRDKSRTSPAIHVANSSDVILENVTIHHAGGMGFIAESSENVRLDRVNVRLPANSKRIVTTTADATHFVNCRGTILLNGCFFESMLDDATNVHGIYAGIDGVVDDHTLGLRRMHSQQLGFDFVRPGDRLGLSEKRTLASYAALTVASVVYRNSDYMEVSFYEPIDRLLRADSVAENLTWQPDLRITGCTVRHNRARSILISTAGNVLVENNHFSTCTANSIFFAGDVTFWHESGPVGNVLIRNNRFSDFGLQGGNAPIIRAAPRVALEGIPAAGYHRNIVFENNEIEIFGRILVSAESVDGFVFRGNRIKRSEAYPAASADGPVFTFRDSRNVVIEDNDYSWGKSATIEVDEATRDIRLERNKGIDAQVKLMRPRSPAKASVE